MNGYNLATNIVPLQSIGDGSVLNKINALLTYQNEDTDLKTVLVAYSISNSERKIVTINCLFQKEERTSLFFRSFDFYKSTRNVDDDLKTTADFGIGIAEYDVDRFMKLRNFYLQNKSEERGTRCEQNYSDASV